MLTGVVAYACMLPWAAGAKESGGSQNFEKRVREKVAEEVRAYKERLAVLEKENEALRQENKVLKDQWDNRDANRKLLENHRTMLESLRKMDWEIIKTSRIMIKALKEEVETLKMKEWAGKTKGIAEGRAKPQHQNGSKDVKQE